MGRIMTEWDDIYSFTALMEEAILETFHVIHQNQRAITNQYYYAADIVDVTFCVILNSQSPSNSNECGPFDVNKNDASLHKSKYVSFATLSVLMEYEQYIVDVISSDQFLKYFNQNMNVKLLSMDNFQCIAMDINDNIVVVDGLYNRDVTMSDPYKVDSVPIIIGILSG